MKRSTGIVSQVGRHIVGLAIVSAVIVGVAGWLLSERVGGLVAGAVAVAVARGLTVILTAARYRFAGRARQSSPPVPGRISYRPALLSRGRQRFLE